ncbi:MAG: HEAT repeat domain-containing protein, partial [Vicinamibacterales bacterium]
MTTIYDEGIIVEMLWLTLRKLRSPNPRKRLEAVPELERSTSPRAIDALGEALLNRSDRDLRRAAALALAQASDRQRAAAHVVAALSVEADASVSAAEVDTLCKLGWLERVHQQPPEDATADLFDKIRQFSDGSVQSMATHAIATINERQRMAKLKAQKEREAREQELAERKSRRLEELRAHLEQHQERNLNGHDHRTAPVREIAELGRLQSPIAIPWLVPYLAAQDNQVREESRRALQSIDSNWARLGGVDQGVPFVARRAVWDKTADAVLAEIGVPLADAMLHLLSDRDHHARTGAVRRLAELSDSRAPEAIMRALADPSGHVVEIAIRSLGQLKYRPAVEPISELLTRCFTSPDRIAKQEGVYCGDDTLYVQRTALPALKALSDERAIPAVILSAERGYWEIQRSAIEVLIALKASKSDLLSVFSKLSTDDADVVRTSVASALGDAQFSSDVAVPLLERLLTDKHSSVRQAATRSIVTF